MPCGLAGVTREQPPFADQGDLRILADTLANVPLQFVICALQVAEPDPDPEVLEDVSDEVLFARPRDTMLIENVGTLDVRARALLWPVRNRTLRW